MISNYEISNGKNVEQIVNTDDENLLFSNQQFLMEICLHSCDVGVPARQFSVVKEWTYLLFEEFFLQGDIELD